MNRLSEAEREGLIEAVQAGTEVEYVEAIVAARLASVEALAPTECWVFRTKATAMSCTILIGGTIGTGPGVFVEEMCCLPCRLRAVLGSDAHTEQKGTGE